ncbi:hypothetical protein CTAYLR_008214 [Chrysophaeum taylorii]|uniref:Mitogen-activated protein kinase n=1 Tax=Chrysophaeum taylorii TaxID=2483200 RepID=A0AAD7UAH5_9STRA|nr:hypothetical protein CTAYLR_008214 [Chrysophaeum taylorii]
MSSQITHVNASEHTIEGWLRKRSSVFTWRRYFVSLNEKRVVNYYARLDARQPVGTIRLSRRTKVSLDPKKEGGLIVHGEKTVRFAAESRRDAVLWKEMLQGAIAGTLLEATARVASDTADPPPKSPPEEFEDFFFDPSCYALSKAIGRGSYGLVVSGRDLRAELPCAIKKIGNAFADLVDAKRIVREIRLMHRLSHPNLLRIYDCYANGLDFDEIYIVTELLQTDLHDVIYARRPLSRAHVQFFCYQLLRGLEHMHAAGVLHRDVKPGNILLNEKCELKLCDFGLARCLTTDMTEYVVTRWYRAPELLLSSSYDGAVDLWSLGCVVAEMVERRPLFGGRDVIDQIRRVASAVKAVRPRDVAQLAFVTNHKARAYVMSIEANEHYDSWADVVPKLSDSKTGLDFLSSLLRFDPANRPSASRALKHPFLYSMVQELGNAATKTAPVDLADIERCPLDRAALQQILRLNDLRYTPPPAAINNNNNNPSDDDAAAADQHPATDNNGDEQKNP